MGNQALGAPRTPAFSYDPGDLIVVTDPSDPLCQPRRNDKPVTREAVIAIAMGPPASSMRVERREGGDAVVTGRQRTKAACVANAIGAGVAYGGNVRAVKDAIRELSGDADFVARVTTLMRNKPIRLTALAANFDDASRTRGMMAIENGFAQAETRRDLIASVQEDVKRFEIPISVVSEQRGIPVATIHRWLKVDLDKPTEKKPRWAAKRPSAKTATAVADLMRSAVEHDIRLTGEVIAWATGTGAISDEYMIEKFPFLRDVLTPKAGRASGKKAA